MNLKPTSILWMASAEAGDTNAQSLNAREIALRLHPELFTSTLFYEREPDCRLRRCSSVRLVQLPRRNRTRTILGQMFGPYDLITYMDYSPASYIFLHAPRFLRRARSVLHVEAPIGQLEGASSLLRVLYHGIVPRCDIRTAITEFVAEELQASGLCPSSILPVGVDTRKFVPPVVPRIASRPVVLFAGTVVERKGVLLVAEIARHVPSARFLIAGAARDGFDEIVRSRIRELQLDNVELLGALSQPEVIRIMQASDVFLLPSRLEGIPKVTLEAAATGLPCVTFNSYKTPSVVDGKTGFQVSTLAEMVDRLQLLVAHPHLRRDMGAAAVRHAKNFDWDVIVPRWQEAYLCMSGKPARLQPSLAEAPCV